MVVTYLLVNCTLVLLRVVYYAMLARVILSFFGVEDSPLMALLAVITEPVAALFRFLHRMHKLPPELRLPQATKTVL